MARRKSQTSPPPENPRLAKPRDEVQRMLDERISKGADLLHRHDTIATNEDFEMLKDAYKKWDSYNTEFLSRAFDSDAVSQEYQWSSSTVVTTYGRQSGAELVRQYRNRIASKISSLESIQERLELIPEADGVQSPPTPAAKGEYGDAVFVVHGHDNEAKESVARFVEKLGLEAIILHEQANSGRTLIEKFEQNAIRAGFALILLTPDDVGAPASAPKKMQPRARQNVVLELGYFVGSLGRDRVQVLYKEGVEIPSDYVGVVYTPLDDSDAWRLQVAKELKQAGFDIDLNDAI